MELGLLHLHNALRWVILILLIVCLYNAFAKKPAIIKTSLWLMISSHIMALIGLYQLIAGRYGIIKGLPEGVSLMKDVYYRFYWVEHPLMMILSIVLITIARGKVKNENSKAAGWLYLVALILILSAIPWPFREIIARPLLPGMTLEQ